jgi:hyperosmotically inducible periplasmic protein
LGCRRCGFRFAVTKERSFRVLKRFRGLQRGQPRNCRVSYLFGHPVAPLVSMSNKKPPKASIIALTLFFCASLAVPIQAQSTEGQVQPDNTKVNKRDRAPGEATADQQKMNATDRALTRKIRRSIMADKSLSTYAHNVKIISQNGTVTLKGPVHSDDEVKTIVAKATAITGNGDKVVNEMSVKP